MMDNEANMMRQQMDKTLVGLTEKLGDLERQVLGTVNSVNNSVKNVRNTFDIKLQVRQHPWTILAGATALGFLAGIRSNGNSSRKGKSTSSVPDHGTAAPPHSGVCDGTTGSDTSPRAAGEKSGWLANLGDTFQPEIAELRGIVIGALLGVVRDIVMKQASAPSEAAPAGTRPRTEEQVSSAQETPR